MMHYLHTPPSGNHAVGTAPDGNRKVQDFEGNSSTRKEKSPELAMIKVQRKGTMEMAHLPLAMVRTYDNLLGSLSTLFPPPEGTEPNMHMSTFEGDLISSPEDYIALLKPGLHIVFHYPPTMEELSLGFDALWPSADGPASMDNDIDTYMSFSSPAPLPPTNVKKYELQPPEIHFQVPTPTPISITLFNTSFPAAGLHFTRDPTQVSITEPSAPKAFGYAPEKSKDGAPAPDFMPTGEGTYAPLPPFSPFSLFRNPSGDDVEPNRSAWGRRMPDGRNKVFSGGTFAITTFDVFAQTERRRVIYSLGWEVEASPGGKVKDLVSEEEMPRLGWHSINEQSLTHPAVGRGRKKTSEKKVYVNYVEPFDERAGEDAKDVERDGWWMVAPRKLPISFSGGREGKRTFLVASVEEGVQLLEAFMARCGVGEEIIKDYTAHWTPKLRFNPPDRHSQTTPTNHTPSAPLYMSLIRPRCLLIKFLHPRELGTLLPLSITPEPHRMVRVFPVFRAVDAAEMAAEDIFPSADFESEVGKVLGGMGSCGGGWDCGHRGFKVAEVGGVRVFGPPDGVDGEEEEGTVVGVSPPRGGWGEIADDEGPKGTRREGYSSGEDTL